MAVQESGKVSKNKVELLAALQDLEASDETTAQANKVAEEKGWTGEDFHRMAHTRQQVAP